VSPPDVRTPGGNRANAKDKRKAGRQIIAAAGAEIKRALQRLGDCDKTTRGNVVRDELDLQRDYLRGAGDEH
jgi:hypothetical protein